MSDILISLSDLASYECDADDAEIRYYEKRLKEHDAKIRADVFKLVEERFGNGNTIMVNRDYYNNWVKEQEQ